MKKNIETKYMTSKPYSIQKGVTNTRIDVPRKFVNFMGIKKKMGFLWRLSLDSGSLYLVKTDSKGKTTSLRESVLEVGAYSIQMFGTNTRIEIPKQIVDMLGLIKGDKIVWILDTETHLLSASLQRAGDR